jgi:hypothetical protein
VVGLQDELIQIKDRIKGDFDKLVEEHEKRDLKDFNEDDVYKQLMSEAIDGKAHAHSKMEIYIESLKDRFPEDALARIFGAPIKSFESPATVLELRTNIYPGFPWKQIVEEKSASVDVGRWDAEGVAPKAVEHVAKAFRDNANLHAVHVAGVKLSLPVGWASAAIDWVGKVAVKDRPATAALLLRNCTGVTSLNIR